jgi:hypothetical protein
MSSTFKTLKGSILILLASTFFIGRVQAQQRSVSDLQAAILLNAIKYIDWPDGNVSESFVMGISGDDKLYSALEQVVQSKQKDGKKITVSKLDVQKMDATACDLFFLGNDAISSFEKAKALFKAKATLLVTNKESYAKKGSAMNFVIVNGKMVIEINDPVIKESGFKVSGSLLSMATVIR